MFSNEYKNKAEINTEDYRVKSEITQTLTDEDREKIVLRLLELLKTQAAKYTGCDSTSLTIERTQEILESLLYTIEVSQEGNTNLEELLTADLNNLIEKGRRILQNKKKSVKLDWKFLCSDLPAIRNVYFTDTLKSIGTFFKKYELYYRAHQIPCEIAYWPLLPVHEETKGISFIEDYLRRLQIETDFINYFEADRVEEVYKRYIRDYRHMLFNLCDPVMTNAIGLSILNSDVRNLDFSNDQQNLLLNMLSGKSKKELEVIISSAILNVCREIGMDSPAEKDYFYFASQGLAARVFEAVKNGDLKDTFI